MPMINLFRQVVVVSVPVTFDGVGARQCMVYMLFLFALKPAPDMKLWMAADSSESDVEVVGSGVKIPRLAVEDERSGVKRPRQLVWQTSRASSDADDDVWTRRATAHTSSDVPRLGRMPSQRFRIAADDSEDEIHSGNVRVSTALGSATAAAFQRNEVKLNVQVMQLNAGYGGMNIRPRLSKSERLGMCPARLDQTLQRRCRCGKCFDKLRPSLSDIRVVLTFWHGHLTASERVFLLSTLYAPSGPDSRLVVTRWELCGHEVCRHAFLNILRMTDRTMVKLTHGVPSVRGSAVRDSPKTKLINQFFLELYMSAAEPMPHEHYMVHGSVDGNIECDDNPWAARGDSLADQPCDSDGVDDLTEAWHPDRSVPDVIGAFLGADVGLPRRYLPHSCLSHLYWVFRAGFENSVETSEAVSGSSDCSESSASPVARSRSSACPTYMSFNRVWRATWSHYMKFRKASQHAECRTCFEARQRIHDSKSTMQERLIYARQWKNHLRDQYHDRAIYWYCRYASRHKLGVLTIIIDSMDKAKFAWPQYPWHRVDKTLECIHRPRLVFTAAIAHGYGTFFYIADDNLTHGASAFCDVLERVIEVVWVMCRGSGVQFPAHLVVQSDNTVAQAKKSLVNVFLAYLVSKYKFQTTSLFYLIVGHTHEDIDQLFGIVLSLVLRKIKFQEKHELMHALIRLMKIKIEAKGEKLYVEVLAHIRAFDSWLMPFGVELYNAFGTRQGIESPHSFTYKLRRDLTHSEQRMIPARARGYDGEEGDVFACVKTYMHDTGLQQPPLMVLPASRVRDAQLGLAPAAYQADPELTPQRQGELRDLARMLRTDVYKLDRAADALEELARGVPMTNLPSTPWLDEDVGNPFAPIVASNNELFPHLPDTSWHLLVRFKRMQYE